MSLRVTHRSLFTSNLNNLQNNLSRIQRTQEKLSSGKVLAAPSDDPAGAGAALRYRADIDRGEQLLRNADDGLGWLATADNAVGTVNTTMQRIRELLVQANNSPVGQDGRNAIAQEMTQLRDQLLSVANQDYLGRPVFGGTTAGSQAYDPAGTYLGDTNQVLRTVQSGVSVAVNVTGPEVFGPPGGDVFSFLTDVIDHLQNDPTQLDADLAAADVHMERVRGAWSKVGARYAQVETLRSRVDEALIVSREKLSEIEDIDLPATITDLQLQETAYQAALSATARSVQPSLLDFLR